MNSKQKASLAQLQQMHAENCVMTSADFVDGLLPKRKPFSHKGDYGRVLILAGSTGYTGAPALAANAALRAGAGLIFVGVPQAVYPIVATKLDEPMVFPLSCDKNGRLTIRALSDILPRLSQCDACLLGPGLGQNRHSLRLVTAILRAAACPIILDADGINALEGHIDELGKAACPVILTPHDGEYRRLTGHLPGENRFQAAQALARQTHATVLLKSHRTLVVGADKSYLNATGNPGMATGGSGDVLAGILLALLGQGLPPTEAAAAAAWLHGATGDFCAEQGQYGLAPTDIIANLPRFLK